MQVISELQVLDRSACKCWRRTLKSASNIWSAEANEALFVSSGFTSVCGLGPTNCCENQDEVKSIFA